MESKSVFIWLFAVAIVFSSCKEQQEEVAEVIPEVKIDLVKDEFLPAQEEIKLTLDSIGQAVHAGDLDKLISFHAYGPKFTEFKNGEPRNGYLGNEEFERSVFGSVTEIKKLDFNDLQIAVYGDVANVTMHADFALMFGEELAEIKEQMTLLFVRTAQGWRIVHEHHSALSPPVAAE